MKKRTYIGEKTNHKTVYVERPGMWYDGANIDVGIAPLIRALWDSGFDTSHCCEGTKKERAYIQFTSWWAAIQFVSIATGIVDSCDAEYASDGYACVRFPKRFIPKLTTKLRGVICCSAMHD